MSDHGSESPLLNDIERDGRDSPPLYKGYHQRRRWRMGFQ